MTIPHWPAMMKRATAAAYLDMSPASFENEILLGRIPHGVMFGGREHWRKDALDKALDQLTGEPAEPDYRRRLRERYGPQAA